MITPSFNRLNVSHPVGECPCLAVLALTYAKVVQAAVDPLSGEFFLHGLRPKRCMGLRPNGDQGHEHEPG